MKDRIANSLGAACAAVLLIASTSVTAAFAQPAGEESHWFRNVRQVTFEEMGLDRSGEAYFSPDCQRIAFLAYPAGQSDYQTYVMNLSGTGLQMVSTGKGATACPFFHPDGKRLLFASSHLDHRRPEDPDDGSPLRAGGQTART